MIPDFTSLNYFNLSPQGDGNGNLMTSNKFTSQFQPIPARGRKRILTNEEVHVDVDFNLSPQGGKKLRIKNGAEFFFCVP
jgi:hypothetical protein